MERTTFDATDDGIEMSDDNGFAALTNAVFDAAEYGRFPTDDADDLYDALRCPSTVSDVTATLAEDDARNLYHALRESAEVKRGDDLSATADTLDSRADSLAFALGVYDGDSA